jgi:RND family efflux transporter MFP subunit
VAQEQAELEMARLTRGRLQSLRKANPEAIPQQEVDLAAAKEQIEAAQVGVAQAEQERLRTLNAFGRLRAPFAGRITKRVLHPGALAREGTTSDALPIVEIARTDKLRIAFEVPEPMAPHVSVGSAAKVRFDAFPGKAIEAKVARLAGALSPGTRSMRAEIDLDNTDGSYRTGMYAAVRLQVEMNEGALTIPSRAVRGQAGDRYCLVAREGVLEKAPVIIASDDGRQAVIAQGLDAEDRVMVAGSPLARAGVSIEAIEEESE